MDKPVPPRIYLSLPHVSGEELESVKHPFASALASRTAAIHLASRLVRVRPDDDVLCAYFPAYGCAVMGFEPQFFAKETAVPEAATPQ